MTITIKKSSLAFLRGINKSTLEIATHFGITEKEAQEAMIHFGMIKARGKKAAEKAYSIKLVDDTLTNEVLGIINTIKPLHEDKEQMNKLINNLETI